MFKKPQIDVLKEMYPEQVIAGGSYGKKEQDHWWGLFTTSEGFDRRLHLQSLYSSLHYARTDEEKDPLVRGVSPIDFGVFFQSESEKGKKNEILVSHILGMACAPGSRGWDAVKRLTLPDRSFLFKRAEIKCCYGGKGKWGVKGNQMDSDYYYFTDMDDFGAPETIYGGIPNDRFFEKGFSNKTGVKVEVKNLESFGFTKIWERVK